MSQSYVYPFCAAGTPRPALLGSSARASDRRAGKRTLVVRYGARRMAAGVVPLALSGVALLVATVGVGWWMAPALATMTGLVQLAVVGMHLGVWLVARLALLLTAILVGVTL